MGLDTYYKDITSDDYIVEINKGNVAGHYHIRKFFENPDFGTTTEDMWNYPGSGAGVYTYTAYAGADYYIASSNDSDTQEIIIGLFDTDFNLHGHTLTLTGRTPVKIVSGTTLWTRAFRIVNNSNTPFLGNIALTEGNAFTLGVPNVTTSVRAYVKLGPLENQTLMCHMSTPANYYAYLTNIKIDTLRKVAAQINVRLYIRKYGKVFTTQDSTGYVTSGTSATQYSINTTGLIAPKSDIKIDAISDAASMAVTGSYDVTFIRSDLVNRYNIFDGSDPNFIQGSQ